MEYPNIKAAKAAVQSNMREVSAADGRKYSLVGYIIESLNQAVTDQDFEANLSLLSSAVTEGADVHAPCWVDKTGNKYYPPLEYLCVLHKHRLQLGSVADIARSIARSGAKLHQDLFVHTNMVEHAQKLLHLTSTV